MLGILLPLEALHRVSSLMDNEPPSLITTMGIPEVGDNRLLLRGQDGAARVEFLYFPLNSKAYYPLRGLRCASVAATTNRTSKNPNETCVKWRRGSWGTRLLAMKQHIVEHVHTEEDVDASCITEVKVCGLKP